ncbi:hypothetical protein [Clostridium sp.]|uniref:hypothetical protein n=1 Tax=Clostridium sp. TaxID=1506 RepID=UPI00262242CF|nr:hypothetical protein [Clostridium sp.]
MKDLTNATITKKAKESIIKEQILEVLRHSKKALSLLEIRQQVDKADKKLIKELLSEFKIKAVSHYEHNSSKTFQHPETKKFEKIKGTHVYKYEIFINKKGKYEID